MLLKKTNDSTNIFQWRCRQGHKGEKNSMIYNINDVRLSIRHKSWLVDCKVPLETVLELIYLWSQGFTHSEVMHELKLSTKTLTMVFRWFKFTLKPPYSGAHERSLLAIWDTSHWNFFVKFGLRTA